MAYLTIAEFKTRSLLPPEYTDAVEQVQEGFTAAQLESCSRLDIDARLAKRYVVPFATPYPEAVLTWLTRLVTHRVCMRRGVDPTDQQQTDIAKDAETTVAQIAEAADSEKGLFDLPLRADTAASGIVKSGPRVYSETSPYVWTDAQVCVGRSEDSARRGT